MVNLKIQAVIEKVNSSSQTMESLEKDGGTIVPAKEYKSIHVDMPDFESSVNRFNEDSERGEYSFVIDNGTQSDYPVTVHDNAKSMKLSTGKPIEDGLEEISAFIVNKDVSFDINASQSAIEIFQILSSQLDKCVHDQVFRRNLECSS
jgi:hypothetical protein